MAVVALLLPGAIALAKEPPQPALRRYVNARFGYALSYPSALIAGPLPANGAGRNFHSRDGRFVIETEAHFLRVDEPDTLESRWQESLKEYEPSASEKNLGTNQFFIRGVKPDGSAYYYQFFVKDKNWVSLYVTFPNAQRDNYQRWEETIISKFVPFQKGDYDRIIAD
jgi:hypothetical protein